MSYQASNMKITVNGKDLSFRETETPLVAKSFGVRGSIKLSLKESDFSKSVSCFLLKQNDGPHKFNVELDRPLMGLFIGDLVSIAGVQHRIIDIMSDRRFKVEVLS